MTTTTKTGKVYLNIVDQWLDTIPASESEEFKEFAEVTPSIIEIWVYAGIVGYEGTFNDLSRWVKMKYKKLNRREILNSEIAALHADIQELRMAITSGEIKGDNGAARLAALEKELRSHIETSERMNRTASRLLMPEVPQALFIAAVEEAVRANYGWIPPYGSGAALYIRPMLIGVGENLGLKPAQSFEFRVFVSPVGPYYKSAGLAAISLAVSDFDRAAPQGTGSYKAGANYAGGLLATLKAQELGASEALYLDSASHRFIDEAGSANIVIALTSGELVTPSSQAILPSITRRSVMEIASQQFEMPTQERAIDLRAEFDSFAEMSACGTAAVLSPVGRVYFDSKWHIVNGDGYTVGPVMQKLYDSLVQLQRGEVEDRFGWLHEIEM